MPDRDYTIRIVTVADNSGAAESARNIEQVGQKGEEAGKKSAEGAEMFNAKGREMHKLIHGLDKLFPGLGLVARAALHPENLGLAGTVFLLHIIVELVGEYKKHLAEAAKHAAELKVAVWESHRDRVREAAEAAEDFAHALEKIATNTDAVKQKEDLELAVLNAQIEARKKLAGKDELRVTEVERQGEQQKIAKLEDIAATRLSERWDAQAVFEAAKRARAVGPAHADEAARAEKEMEGLKAKTLAAQTALDGANANIRSPEQLAGMGQMERGIYYQALPKFKEEVEKATANLQDAQRAQNEADAQIRFHKAATKRLADAEDEAAKKVEETIKAYRDANAAASKEKGVFGAKLAGEDTIELTAAGLKPQSVLGRTLLRDIEAQEGRSHGASPELGNDNKLHMVARLNAEQQMGTRELLAALRQAGNGQAKINEIFKHMADLHLSHKQKLEEVLSALRLLKQQQRGLITNPT